MFGAEEAHGTTKARSVVLETAHGNLNERAVRITSDERSRRFTIKREAYAKTDSIKQGRARVKCFFLILATPFCREPLGYYSPHDTPEKQPHKSLQDVPSDKVVGSMNRHWKV